jgi:hypothetical protein
VRRDPANATAPADGFPSWSCLTDDTAEPYDPRDLDDAVAELLLALVERRRAEAQATPTTSSPPLAG